MKINKNALIRSYAQSMGIEAAKDLITKKINAAALEEKEHYTEEEAAKICAELIKEGGLIRIVAQNFVLQLERKRSEEQALLLDNIETPIWYLTDRETYGAVNKAQAEFLGMGKEKLEGRVLYDIISVEEADVCIANNKEVFEKKKQSHTEEWVKNGRGETRLLSITRTPKIDDNGTVEYVICAAEDITERKKAEEKIKEADIIIKKSPAVAFTWKNEEGWPVEYVSENVKNLFGYSTEDFLSRKISYAECVYLDDLERVEQEVADFSKEEEREEFVHEPYRILTKDNNVKVVKDWTFIVRDFEGKITHYKGIIEDITERKKAEEALQESKERFRALIESTSDWIWEVDENAVYTYTSPKIKELLGYEPEEIIGKTPFDLMTPEDVKRVAAEFGAIAEAQKPFERLENENLHKNGRILVLESSGVPIFDANGNFRGYRGIGRDITERKQEEARIEHLNSVLKAIRDVNQEILVEKDRDSLLQKACDALTEARGYDAAWLGFLSDGETFAMVKGSGFREEVARFCEHVMGGDHTPCIKNALAQKDPFMVVDKSRECGDCFFKSACASNEAAIIRVEYAGRLFGLLAILFAPGVTADEEEKGLLKEVAGDIAFALHDMEMEEVRKQAEEKLRNAEADWRNSFNSLEDVMLIIDRDYNIEKINEIGLKLLGKSNEEVIGKKCYQIISGVDSPREDCPCMKSLETKKVESCDRYEERFGKYYSIQTAPIFDDNGAIIKFVDLRRDITERKQAEEKVKEAYRLREHFLKETSHRIITPVAIIGGNTDLLLKSSNLDDAQKEKIRAIRERNEEVQKLVRDALAGKYLEGEEGEG